MSDHDRPPDDRAMEGLAALERKLDTVAGAVAAIAASHTELLAHVAEAEFRRGLDAREVAQRMSAMERQLLALPARPGLPGAEPAAPVDLEPLRSDVTLGLDVLARLTEAVDRLESRTEDRLAAVQGATDDLRGRLADHTDTALAGALRVIDDRLTTMRSALTASGPGNQPTAGFEAGAVMGAAQAAWNRLEQRLDAEFDDLGRQLQAMADLIERATTDSAGPAASGRHLRRAASVVKDTVVGAGRTRRDRRGGPRGLGQGD